MSRLLGVATAAALILTPLAAVAQGHGGHGYGGHGGYGGGEYRGSYGGYRGGGGYYGRGGYGYRGQYGYRGGYFAGGLGLGIALGAYPWHPYGGPAYYGYGPSYSSYYDYGPPPPVYADAPVASGPALACGAWSWIADQNRYLWVPAACAAPGP